jgi:uncharacterized protein (TIGR00288 family)
LNQQKFNIAVLIDGDNAQAKLIKEIIEEVSKYGKVTVRRIYGDWTTSHMNSWKETINHHSFSPIQMFSYTSGKNSTDSSLIIDAMDILHSKSVEGFCIVSSDSDYTGLAKRIREEGLFVMGIGRKTTPIAFVNSCEIFTFSENLIPEKVLKPKVATKKKVTPNTNQKRTNKSQTTTDQTTPEPEEAPKISLDLNIIDRAFEISINEEEEAYISSVGLSLRKIEPSFDPRTYGFRNLTQLIESLSKYKIVKNVVNGLNHPLIKRR